MVVKQLFGGIGQNFANPAITARVILLLCGFGGAMTTFAVDGVTAATGAYSRGTSMQGLAVCRVYECPSILVELGFVSNPNEYESLASDRYIALEAQGIANGIVAYLQSNKG